MLTSRCNKLVTTQTFRFSKDEFLLLKKTLFKIKFLAIKLYYKYDIYG